MSKNLKNKFAYEVSCVFDPLDFEYHCGSCVYFPPEGNHNEDTMNCPYYDDFIDGKLDADTDWREIKCDRFYD